MPHYTPCAGTRLLNQKLAFPEDERVAAGHFPAEFASNELPPRPVSAKVGGAAFLNAVSATLRACRDRRTMPPALGKAEHRVLIAELERGLQNPAEAAARDFPRDLFRTLRPDITFGEIQGARAVLELILTALPTYPDEVRL
jgi:hypothetical protein